MTFIISYKNLKTCLNTFLQCKQIFAPDKYDRCVFCDVNLESYYLEQGCGRVFSVCGGGGDGGRWGGGGEVVLLAVFFVFFLSKNKITQEVKSFGKGF